MARQRRPPTAITVLVAMLCVASLACTGYAVWRHVQSDDEDDDDDGTD